MQAPRSLSNTTASLEYEILLKTTFWNKELVLLARIVYSNESEKRIHELVGVGLEFAVLPLLLEHYHVVGNCDLPLLIPPLPSFLIEEVVLGCLNTAGTKEEVSADAIAIAQTDQLRCLRLYPVFRHRSTDDRCKKDADYKSDNSENHEPKIIQKFVFLQRTTKLLPNENDNEQCKKEWPDHFFLLSSSFWS